MSGRCSFQPSSQAMLSFSTISAHTKVRQAIRTVGAKRIFLPKYSPDLNPIEQVFAKLKTLLRKAAPRSTDDVCAAIGQLLESFEPEECTNYFRNAGYAST